ncbi:MAG TPA: 6-phosphogluconolactonase, partial [Actinomycetota bacterium]|nr:6-phosphogluconolactonase [Actinomycetota bacterium]
MAEGPELRVVDEVAAAAEEEFLAARPRTVLLTGGSTPKRLYERLAAANVDWTGVELFLSDERCVPVQDDRSNERMIREALASRVPASFHPMDGVA